MNFALKTNSTNKTNKIKVISIVFLPLRVWLRARFSTNGWHVRGIAQSTKYSSILNLEKQSWRFRNSDMCRRSSL